MRWRVWLLFLPVMLGAWQPTVDFVGTGGDFRRGGGFEVWAPVWGQRSGVLFAQGGGGRFLDLYGANVGVGGRWMVNPWVGAGLNAFFDVARSDIDRTYLQGGVGAELFGRRWVARANGYFPNPNRLRRVTTEARLEVATNDIIDLNDTLIESALFGGDGEVGLGFCVLGDEVWVFAGAYGYNGFSFPGFVGPRARVEYRLRDVMAWCGAEVIVAGEYLWDRYHRSQGAATLKIRVPLGRKQGRRRCLTICDRMSEPVQRAGTIWALQRRQVRAVRNAARPTGGPIFFVTEGGTGNGTQASPTNINVAYANALPGDAIVLLPGPGGDTIRMDNAGATAAPYPLLTGSSMAAFGDLSQMTLIVQGRPVKIEKLGTATDRVTLTTTNPAGNDLIRADGNNEIFNFNTADGERAIVSPTASLVRVRDMQINTPGNNGIDLTNATQALITGTTITSPQGQAISIANGSTVTLEQITATGVAANQDAIFFSGDDLMVNVGTGFSLTGAGGGTGAGFNLMNASNVRFNGTVATPIQITNMGRGILATNPNDLALTSVNIAGSAGNGFEATGATGTLTYSVGTINTSGASAVSLSNSTASTRFWSISVDTAAQGYSLAGNTGNVTISDSPVQNITNQGVVVNSLTGGTLSIEDINVSSATTGVEVAKTDGTAASVLISKSAFSNLTNGLLMSVDGSRTLNVSVKDSQFTNIQNGVGGSFLASGTGAMMNNTLSRLTFLGVTGDALLIGSNAGTSDGVRVLTLVENSFFGGSSAADQISEKAISLVNVAPGATPSNFDTTISGCQFDRVQGGNMPEAVILLQNQGQAGASTVAITNCLFGNIPSRGILATWDGTGFGTSINMTIRNNTWDVIGNPNNFIELVADSSSAPFCVEILTNSSASAANVLLSSPGATGSQFQVVAPGFPVGTNVTSLITGDLQAINSFTANSVVLSPANPPGPARFSVVSRCPQPVLPPNP